MSSCIHCHVRMPRSRAERSPNPQRTHTHSVFPMRYRDPCFNPCLCLYSHNWMCRVGLYPKSEKIQRAQTAFVSHRVCQQPLLRLNGFLLVKLLQWKSSPKSRTGGSWALNSPTASSCGWRFELQELSVFPKTLKIYGTAAIMKFHTVSSRESWLRCYKIYSDSTKGFRNY